MPGIEQVLGRFAQFFVQSPPTLALSTHLQNAFASQATVSRRSRSNP